MQKAGKLHSGFKGGVQHTDKLERENKCYMQTGPRCGRMEDEASVATAPVSPTSRRVFRSGCCSLRGSSRCTWCSSLRRSNGDCQDSAWEETWTNDTGKVDIYLVNEDYNQLTMTPSY